MEWRDLVQETKIGQVVEESRPLYFVDDSTTVEAALQYLREKNILSVPVFNKQIEQFIGIVDVIEICKFTAFGKYFQLGTVDESSFENFVFPSKTIGELVMNNERCSIQTFSMSSPFQQVIAAFTNGEYSVLVWKSGEGNNCVFVTQSDVVSYLGRRAKESGSKLLQADVGSLFKGKDIVSITTKDRALDGFLAIYSRRISAVPIVDEQGKIVGTLSASDLRGMTRDKLSWLLLPALQFVNDIKACLRPEHPITCTTTSKLQEVLDKIQEHRIHRVWVVDEHQRPIGVISLTDIMALAS